MKTRGSSRAQTWAVFAATIFGYEASVQIRRGFMTASPEAAIWLGAGLIAGLILLPGKYRLWCLAVCIAVNAVLGFQFGLRPWTYLTFPLALMVTYATERLLGPSPDFADPRRLGLYLIGAVAPACAVLALVQLWLPFGPPVAPQNVARWFIGHVLGLAILVPSILIIARARRFASFQRSFLETFAALLVMVAFVGFLFWREERYGWAMAVFPMAMFVAFRYGPVGVSVMSLLLTGFALAYVYGAVPHLGDPRLTYGQTEWVQVLVTLIFLTSLPAAGVVAYLQRMHRLFAKQTTLARVARARADQAARAKGEFLANMSHEIRTPLNGVIGLTDALSRTPLAPNQKEMLGMILSSGQALRGLLSDALDLARAQSGALSLTAEPFDVRKTVGAAGYLFHTLAQEKGLSFQLVFDLRPERPLIGDALRIRQVVSNLISNAVKFTESGGVEIVTTVREAGQDRAHLSIAVRDTGRGFDEATKARLFNRFEQGDNSVTRRYGGSGLGLSIVRELAAMMGGDVTCRSTPGAGSVFVFELEALLQAGDESLPVETSADDGYLAAPVAEARPRLLLAEDHLVNQKVVQAILGDRFEMTVVADGQAAIDAFRAQAFDVILMDTHMPVMDGLTAIRAIRRIEAATGAQATRIISLTADALSENVREAMRAGADRHLAKPITAATLFAALAAPDEEAATAMAGPERLRRC